MQPTPSGSGGSSGGGGGGGEVNRVGLARFLSAPPTWLETLLEEEEEESFKPNQTLTQLLESNTRNSLPYMVSNSLVEPVSNETAHLFEPAATAFPRQNSSPADFLLSSGIGNEGYYSSSYGLNASKYEYNTSPEVSTSSGKRVRDNNLHLHQSSSTNKYPSLVKVEQNSQVPSGSGGGGGMSSLIEMEMEKILEDSVPCRVRAKRGCATHPRSIAERVRRTRISDRIRKLQELVPNMDKVQNPLISNETMLSCGRSHINKINLMQVTFHIINLLGLSGHFQTHPCEKANKHCRYVRRSSGLC